MNLIKTSALLGLLTALFMVCGYLLGGTVGMFIALAFAIGTNAFAFWRSDQLVLRLHNARLVNHASHPQLVEMTERLARNADMPIPDVYVIDTDQPNAFATGRNPDNAAVAATTGIMNLLSYQELEGVMAHELAHIKNRDTLIMTVAGTIAGALSTLATFAQFGMMFRGSGGRNGLSILATMAAMILAPMAAGLVQMAISRTREYSADRLGAEICRNPLALASALRKIEQTARGVVNPTAEKNPGTAHLFIINPLNGQGFDKLFSTHPNTANRIAALELMAGEGLSGAGSDGGIFDQQGSRGLTQAGPKASKTRIPTSGRSPKNDGPWS